MTYQDSDIRDVLAAFAAFSGRTIVVGKDVQGTVTAEVRDQPWDVALQSILASQQLAASEDQYGIITVDSYKNIQAKQASEPLVTQLVTMNYANAFGLVKTVQVAARPRLRSRRRRRRCGPGTEPGLPAARERGRRHRDQHAADHRGAVAHAGRRQLHSRPRHPHAAGFDQGQDHLHQPDGAQLARAWPTTFGDNGTFFNKLVQRINPTTGQPYPSNVTAVNLGGDALAGSLQRCATVCSRDAALSLLYTAAVGKFSLTSFLDATSSLQLSDVQAEPSVVTLDNRLAQIQVGEETPIRVIDAAVRADRAAPPVATVQWKETGIILDGDAAYHEQRPDPDAAARRAVAAPAGRRRPRVQLLQARGGHEAARQRRRDRGDRRPDRDDGHEVQERDPAAG